MGRHRLRELRATTALKRTILLAIFFAIVMTMIYALRSTWAARLDWDVDTVTDLWGVVAFFLGSLLGTGALISALEVRRNGERLRWQDSTSVDPSSESAQ